MSRQASGFTLIELMIVVAIIAILAALAVPAYQDYVIRSQISEGITLADGGKSAVWDFMANTGRSPADNASAGMPTPTSLIGNYVASVTVTNGKIIAQFGRSSHSVIMGGKIVMSPVTMPGSIPWHCLSTTIPAKYLPTACR